MEIGGEGVGPDPERLQGYGTSPGEGVDDQGAGAGYAAKGFVGRLIGPGGLKIPLVGRVVPVGKVGDEIEERPPEPRGSSRSLAPVFIGSPELSHYTLRVVEEPLRAWGVVRRWGRVRPEGGADDGPAGCEVGEPTICVQGRYVAVPDGFLAASVPADLFNREVDLDQPFGILCFDRSFLSPQDLIRPDVIVLDLHQRLPA